MGFKLLAIATSRFRIKIS